jgi:hypothetical protein
MRTTASRTIRFLWALVRGADSNTLARQVSNWAPKWSAQRWAYRFPLAYESLREMRSVFHRILELHERGLAQRGVEMILPASVPIRLRDAVYRAHSEGRQNLQTSHPWVTLVDVSIFWQGFVAGCVCLSGNPRCGMEAPQNSPTSDEFAKSGNASSK